MDIKISLFYMLPAYLNYILVTEMEFFACVYYLTLFVTNTKCFCPFKGPHLCINYLRFLPVL